MEHIIIPDAPREIETAVSTSLVLFVSSRVTHLSSVAHFMS